MTQKTTARASRFKIPNNERVVVSIDADRFAGTLCVLSLTGGTVRMTKRPPSGTLAEIKMNTVTGTLTAVIEMLAARPDGSQAFRFVQLEAAHRKQLKSALDVLQEQGLGDGRTAPMDHVMRFARRLLPKK